MDDNRQTCCGRGHGNDRATEGHDNLVAHGLALHTVCVVVFTSVLGAVPVTAQDNMSSPAARQFPGLVEDRRETPPYTAWGTWAADPAASPPPTAGGPVQPFPLGVELPQNSTVSEPFDSRSPREVDWASREPWTWQALPDGIIYPSYLAGPKEARFASVWNHDAHFGWMWDLEAGARVGLLRYGTTGSPRPDGWELDLEGAAFPRLDLDHNEDLVSVDFRGGIPLTFGSGPFRTKLAVYHLSSHLGDEYMLRFPEYPRINYSRNALVLGGSYYATDDLRLYAEAEWAFYTDGGTKPWEFQFGLDYSPIRSANCTKGSPFLAINGQIREEVDYRGTLVAQAGWQWRGSSNHLFRMGVQYSTGKSDQFQFYRRNEEKVGMAIWYDF